MFSAFEKHLQSIEFSAAENTEKSFCELKLNRRMKLNKFELNLRSIGYGISKLKFSYKELYVLSKGSLSYKKVPLI